MSISLVTGHLGESHVTSAQAAQFNRAVFSANTRVFTRGNAFNATMINNNTIRISDGDMILQGRHVCISSNDYEELSVDSGTAGSYRNDLVIVEYTRNQSTGVENVQLKILKGTSTTNVSNVTDPTYTNANIDTSYLSQYPLWRIPVRGVNIDPLVRLFTPIGNMVSITNLYDLIYPVGSIYISVNNTNPGTLFGGTWVAWGSGRVPVGVNTSDTAFNTVEKTGGAKTNTITIAQMPAHTHSYDKSGSSTGSTTLTTSQIPAHTHTYTKSTVSSNTGGPSAITDVISYDGFQSKLNTFNTALHTALERLKLAASAPSFDYPLLQQSSAADRPTSTHTHSMGTSTSSANSGSTGGGTGHTHTISTSSANTGSVGGGDPHSILQPYITCYMWKRTA